MGLVAQRDGLARLKKRGDTAVGVNRIVCICTLAGNARSCKLDFVISDVSTHKVVCGAIVADQRFRSVFGDGSAVKLIRDTLDTVGVNGLLVFVNELNVDCVALPINRTNGQSLRDSNPFNLALALNRAHLDLHRQPIGDVFGGDRVLAVLVGGDRVDGLDRGNLHALGGSSRELQLFVRGDVGLLGGGSKLFAVDRDSGALGDVQIDGSNLALLDRRRRLRARIGRRLGLGAQNRVGRGVRGGGFGCRLGRRLDGLDHGLFGCLRAVGRRGLIRRSRRLIGHGGVCRLRSGGLHAGIIHRRGDILARLLVGQRAACECRRAHHLRGEQNRQDDGRCLDAEIPPTS